jgi:hypothetical protein
MRRLANADFFRHHTPALDKDSAGFDSLSGAAMSRNEHLPCGFFAPWFA